ncbi:hypothetical protein ACFL2V_10190 [Pseudomonadota bacterium]
MIENPTYDTEILNRGKSLPREALWALSAMVRCSALVQGRLDNSWWRLEDLTGRCLHYPLSGTFALDLLSNSHDG